MARKVVVTLVDDVDNSLTADETISFGIDGVEYAIDLSALNAAKLRRQLKPWTSNATKINGTRGRKTAGAARNSSPEQWAVIREWAPQNGFGVCSRGRIPDKVVAAFEAAHS